MFVCRPAWQYVCGDDNMMMMVAMKVTESGMGTETDRSQHGTVTASDPPASDTDGESEGKPRHLSVSKGGDGYSEWRG